jgi:cellulose synthase operon protein YhjU
MGLWSFYFSGKLFLYLWGALRFDLLLNLLFSAFLVLPVPETIPFHRTLKTGKLALHFILGFLLLWYDSYLPPLIYSIRTFHQIGLPEKEYVYRFMLNAVNPLAIAILIGILALCIYLNRRIKLTPLVVVLMLLVPIYELTSKKEGLTEYLNTFYQSESKRGVSFSQTTRDADGFDILILHICSLSWDDLRVVGHEKHPFFSEFDILFSNFNSVSSYTNPSAIRLLRANCGQHKHESLYQDAPRECFLLENLRDLDYETYTAIDNDAPGYRFVEDIMLHGRASSPISLEGIPVQQYDFDRTPIYNDRMILERWWDIRQESATGNAVLYFDITTLHGGSHRVEDNEWWKKDPASRYEESLLTLFDTLGSFFRLLESADRNFVIVFIPEHGMALRGSSIQAPDLRDIPLPQITTIPVGVKLIGPDRHDIPGQQEIIDRPASYLAVAEILASFLKEPPFMNNQRPIKSYVRDLAETSFVAENQEALVVKRDSEYYLFGKEKSWSKLPASVIR